MEAAFNKFDSAGKALVESKINLATDVLKVFLTNQAPLASNTVKANFTEVANGNGYTTGGNQAVQTSSAQAAGVYTLICNDPSTWTASGGSIGPFRYAVFYSDTATNKDLIGWWDYGLELTLGVAEQFAVDMDQALGVLGLS